MKCSAFCGISHQSNDLTGLEWKVTIAGIMSFGSIFSIPRKIFGSVCFVQVLKQKKDKLDAA